MNNFTLAQNNVPGLISELIYVKIPNMDNIDKPLILIVDDERAYADKLSEELKATGKYAAMTAYSAKEAMQILTKYNSKFIPVKNPVKVMLLDIKMPEMDGWCRILLLRG